MRYLLAGMFAILASIAVPAVALSSVNDNPPECRTVPLYDGNYTIKATFCGTGPFGEFPLRPSVKSLNLDGGFNHKHIYIFWPDSWTS